MKIKVPYLVFIILTRKFGFVNKKSNLNTNIFVFKREIEKMKLFDGELQVCTGEGEDTEEVLYQNRKSAIWNQRGDTAYLYDDKGVLIHKFSYDEIVIEED